MRNAEFTEAASGFIPHSALRSPHSINPDSYVPRTLKYELQKRGRLPFNECLRVALALTTALKHLHHHGLIHRDIKPSNIIFVHGVPKLADIGLVTDLDATMSFVGTEGFLPPEGRGSVQADLYSLGKVFYEMATGKDRLDFPEPTTNLRELPDRESLVEFNEVVLRACAPDPRQRYQTAEELHADLVLLQAGKSLKRARWLEQRLALATRAGLAAALVALVAIGYSYQSKRAAHQALEQTYRVHIAQGVHTMDDGDLFSSAMWFAKALNLGHHNRDQEEINRWRIGTTLSFCPALTQMIFHQDLVRRAVFSPDGVWIATASDDCTARVWEALSGEPVTPALKHEAKVRDVEFSPDGRWLVTASEDHTARVWDAATGTAISPLLKHEGIVFRAAFHPNGSFVVTCSGDHTARIWNARTGEPVGLPLQHEDRVQCVRFNPDGEWVATASRDGTARIWRTPDLVRTRSTASLTSPPGVLQPTGEEREDPDRPGVSVVPFSPALAPQGELRDGVESVPTD
ncbi:MAG: WD40 repeat domain-containing serine/threonine-protein kinase [Verrucomicrobiota bacterium]